jgi:hypothetical protein
VLGPYWDRDGSILVFVSTVRIALANIRITATPDDSVCLATAVVADAARQGAGVLCFPECFIPGYRWLGQAAPAPDPAFLERAWAAVADAARAARITVILGTERITDRGLQITACVINPDGTIAGWTRRTARRGPRLEYGYRTARLAVPHIAALIRTMTGMTRVDRLAIVALLLLLPACGTTTGPDPVIVDGTWGGEHALLEITGTSASIEFDCAHGTLQVPLTLTRGTFDVSGEYVQEHGGPIRSDETVVRQPARYTGSVNGTTMTLQVRLTATAEDRGTYTLTRGSSGRVFKCL